MTVESPRDLFERELREFYYVIDELGEFQRKLAEEATDDELQELFASHQEKTDPTLDRLDRVFDAIDADPGGRDSQSLDGVMERQRAVGGDIESDDLRDAFDAEIGLVIERLEITRLDALLALADRLDLGDDATEPLETIRTEAEDGVDQLRGALDG